jgi:predicted ester cyclase
VIFAGQPSDKPNDFITSRLQRIAELAELVGFPGTGRTIEYVSHEFYRIADGLIAEEWICSDTATLFRQLS